MALLHVDFFSDVLGMCVEMDVILPENTSGQIGMEGKNDGGKWKTMYLLHGMSDDHTIWQRRTSIERYVSDKGIAVVMPSTQLGWYTDMYMGHKWYTYIAKELPAICRSFFPNMSDKREDTFVCGLSMGGYGAMKLALRDPETFGYGASLSGGLDVEDTVCNLSLGNEGYWTDVFGPKDEVKGSFNDLFQAACDLKASGRPLPKLYMWCGEQDFLYHQNVKMRDHLNALSYDLTYEESPGIHSWKYWDEKIQTVLEWLPISKEGN
ncbi:MAG: esterase family protein [Clostridia bacterium]|nr:esterase family protein [Clostridia bacterium]